MNDMIYCKHALKWLGRKTVCGMECPIYPKCPALIMQDASLDQDEIREKAIAEAMDAMMEIIKKVSIT